MKSTKRKRPPDDSDFEEFTPRLPSLRRRHHTPKNNSDSDCEECTPRLTHLRIRPQTQIPVVKESNKDSKQEVALPSPTPVEETVTESEVYRLEQSTKDTHSSVICKLSRVFSLPELQTELARVAVVMKQLQLEAWHLANLHILRCVKDGEDVPDLDQMFFYRCYSAVLGNTEAHDRASITPKYPSFRNTCLQYWIGREREILHLGDGCQ